MASDSRLSKDGRTKIYNYSKKIFPMRVFPDILGYCGEVLFPTQFISQIVDLCDSGVLFETNAGAEEKSNAIYEQLKIQYNNYTEKHDFVIYHMGRIGNGDLSEMYVYKYKVHEGSVSKPEIICKKNGVSEMMFSAGSGKEEFDERYVNYNHGNLSSTSRNIFQCLCDTISNTKLISVGGAPQLSSIYRTGGGKSQGIIWQNNRYFSGSPVFSSGYNSNITWFNENFERCNPITMQRAINAQRQPNPNRSNQMP